MTEQRPSNLDVLAGTSYYQFNRDQLEALANKLMEQIETVAYNDGVITDQYLFSKNYVITLVRPNVLTRIFDKLFMRGVDQDRAVFRILAVPADLSEYDPDEEEQPEKPKKGTILSILKGGKKETDQENKPE